VKRPTQLVQIAAQAEGIRLRAVMVRVAIRAGFALVAGLFTIGALVFAHIAAWYWLLIGLRLTVFMAVGALTGADLLIAIILGYLASRSRPSRTERQARDVRRGALDALERTFNPKQLALPVARFLPQAWRPRWN
jgi:hypothetical protein